MRVVLALGSNQGNRLDMLQGAVDALAAVPGLSVLAVSGVYETEPVGGPPQPDYLNAVVLAEGPSEPRQVLDRAQAVEDDFGRVREERWGPRTLDVDVIAVGDLVVDEADLQLPHPRAADRAFVLLPWLDVDPDAALPYGGKVADLLAGVDATGVHRRDDLDLTLPA
jgi:2-amino-4-hydroxy-6-hydroxymethyldihydropteridine diphosphokinase